MEVTDAQLLERFVSDGDEAAFQALVERYGGMALGVCQRILATSSKKLIAAILSLVVLSLLAVVGAMRFNFIAPGPKTQAEGNPIVENHKARSVQTVTEGAPSV